MYTILNPVCMNTINIPLNLSLLNLPAKLQGKTSAQSLIISRQSGALLSSPRASKGERCSFQNGQASRHLSEHSFLKNFLGGQRDAGNPQIRGLQQVPANVRSETEVYGKATEFQRCQMLHSPPIPPLSYQGLTSPDHKTNVT